MSSSRTLNLSQDMLKTAKMELLRSLVSERLSAAAQEIFRIVEKTMMEYEEEMSCSKWEVDSQRRLMDVTKSRSEDSLHMCSTDVKLQVGLQQQPASLDISVSIDPRISTEPTEDLPNMNDIQADSSPDSERDHQSDQELLLRDNDIMYKSDPDTPPNIHKVKKEFQCPVCLCSFSSKKMMMRHLREHSEDKSSYQCQFYSQRFLHESEFVTHTRTHHSDDPERYQDQRDSQLIDKQAQTEEETFQRVSEPDIKMCPLNVPPFDKSEFDQESLQPLCLYQIQTVADIDNDSTATDPVSHIKTEPNEADCGVSGCTTDSSLLFSSNPGEQRETESNHYKPNKALQIRPSGKPSELRLQFETGTAEKPYKCPCCPKCFSLTKTLLRHLKVHAQDRLYPCHICGRTFCQKSDLVNHTRVHTGERPFQCPECHKSFTQKGNLLVHMRKHSESAPRV
ncbi:zinc finger protein 182-like [Notolabrus celidotus]|uniref:zinc finger protein 182-like n=1 Tax=Notolabrus celidotus TaxID=1203425 RepID=UPI00148FEAC8|nr:zinc finger protein 182-like [Notolabrus celidotus]